jgi:hypothetical protein
MVAIPSVPQKVRSLKMSVSSGRRNGLAGFPVRLARLALAFALFATLTLLAVEVDAARAATSANAQSALAINLASVDYWTSEMPFMNIFAMGSQWVTHNGGTYDTHEEQYLDLDANGWLKSLTAVNDPNPQVFTSVGVLLLRVASTANGYYPAGKYVVLYDGQGEIDYGFDAKLVSRSPGRDVFTVANPSSAGIDLRITSTDPNHTGNYIRNIQVVKAENETAIKAGQIFNPTFLSAIAKFRALRFKDWLAMDSMSPTALTSWSNRPLPTFYSWDMPDGVPIEITVDLANALSADPWLNVPVGADDNYITQMATLVHSMLGPTQKAYIELSNEVWNGSYQQYNYALSQGKALWPTAGQDWNANWYGMRTAQMCDLWKSAWGSDASRVVCVMAAQAAGTVIDRLQCPYWSGGPCYQHGIGAVAIAPYFGLVAPSAWTSQPDGGLNMLFQSLTTQNDPSVPAGGALARSSGWEVNYIKELAPYKLPLIAYEAGQSLCCAATTALTNLYIAANRDPRMGAAYATYLQQWKANGGELMALYNDIGAPSWFGSWGQLESLMQTTSPLSAAPPKWQAIQNFIASDPCWWAGCTGTIGSTTTVVPMPATSVSAH